jgi:ribosomal protein S18 acetylase RimI-like enzyme
MIFYREQRLIIKVLNKPNKEITKQIKEVELICKAYDRTNGNIYLDSSLNFYPEIKSLFLLYEDNKLISLLSIFMPMANEAEISAYTLPDHRRKGYFKRLLNRFIEELKKYEQVDLLFVCEPQSKDGKEAVQKLGAELCFTEYFLRYKGSSSAIKKKQYSKIKLREAGLKDLEEIIALYQQIFGDNYEDAKSMITKSFEAENRTQYIAILDNKLIGMASVSFENVEASLFGLGISPQYQGKGLGKELLNIILEDLKKRNIQNISIEVDSINENALHLYIKSGFEVETSYDYYRKNETN